MKKLNDIKENVHHFKEHDFHTTMLYEDYLWLIETIEKQQEENKNLNQEVSGHSGTLDAIVEEFSFLTGRLKNLQQKMVKQ